MVRAAKEAMSGLESESVIPPTIIRRALNQRKPIRLPPIGARHPAHGRPQRLPRSGLLEIAIC